MLISMFDVLRFFYTNEFVTYRLYTCNDARGCLLYGDKVNEFQPAGDAFQGLMMAAMMAVKSTTSRDGAQAGKAAAVRINAWPIDDDRSLVNVTVLPT